MKDSSKEVNLGNNSTQFRFKCDIFGTGKGEIEVTSLFLHNLSSILYTGGREGAPIGVPSSHRAVSCIGPCASGVMRQASCIGLCCASCAALHAASARQLKTFSKKCLTEIAVLLI